MTAEQTTDDLELIEEALDYGGEYMPDPRTQFDGFKAVERLRVRLTALEQVAIRAQALDDEYARDGECGYSYHEALHVALAVLDRAGREEPA